MSANPVAGPVPTVSTPHSNYISRWDGADPKNVGLYDIVTGGLCMYDNCQNNEVDSTLSAEPVNGWNPCLKKLKLCRFIIQSSKMVSLDNTPSKHLRHSTEPTKRQKNTQHLQQHSLLINNQLHKQLHTQINNWESHTSENHTHGTHMEQTKALGTT